VVLSACGGRPFHPSVPSFIHPLIRGEDRKCFGSYAQLQPHTRIDFIDNSLVPSSSSPCFLSFEAREEVKEAKKRKKKTNPWT